MVVRCSVDDKDTLLVRWIAVSLIIASPFQCQTAQWRLCGGLAETVWEPHQGVYTSWVAGREQSEQPWFWTGENSATTQGEYSQVNASIALLKSGVCIAKFASQHKFMPFHAYNCVCIALETQTPYCYCGFPIFFFVLLLPPFHRFFVLAFPPWKQAQSTWNCITSYTEW